MNETDKLQILGKKSLIKLAKDYNMNGKIS